MRTKIEKRRKAGQWVDRGERERGCSYRVDIQYLHSYSSQCILASQDSSLHESQMQQRRAMCKVHRPAKCAFLREQERLSRLLRYKISLAKTNVLTRLFAIAKKKEKKKEKKRNFQRPIVQILLLFSIGLPLTYTQRDTGIKGYLVFFEIILRANERRRSRYNFNILLAVEINFP